MPRNYVQEIIVINKEQVLKALSHVMDPDLHRDLVSLNMIEDIEIDVEKVSFSIVLTTPSCPLKNQIEADARRAVLSMTEASEVDIKMTARVTESKTVNLGDNCFKHVIAVGSGKGGVGKSTVALNLALALSRDGAKVGLLDADIYGPNIPRMLGLDRLPESGEGKKIAPAEIHGLKVVSIGFLVQPGQPLIWRGPMLHSAIQQFITDFDWGNLDYLVVDLPPGTGDVQLSLAQSLPISGAVIVTTPQQVSVDDASRAANMFAKLEIPLFGIIENMAYLEMPDGSRQYVFGEKGGEHLASQLGAQFLGRIPLDANIGLSGDIGNPIVAQEPLSPSGEALISIARNIAAEASKEAFKKNQAG
ncbi:MAG: Mrp/NBP35 family ATP-binding protein [Chloroflexi bacterium]|nr:Mrp/NBP35 family ATP-binding protein [Chloroflexota bacterium]